MYITLNKWLNLFKTKNITYEQFIKVAKVKSSNNKKKTLNEIIKKKKLSKTFLKKLYKLVVTDKNIYLTNFYNKSLKVKELNEMPICINNNKFTEYKNQVRNPYYKDILLDTNTIQPNIRPYLQVIIELFKNHIIDYKLVTPSVIKLIEKELLSNVLSGLYFRSSIMNPTIPYSLSTFFNKPFNVLTPTLGWSSYLLGILNNKNLNKYVGIDVIPKVCNNTRKIANSNNIKNDIYCVPSEDLYKNKKFMKKYNKFFDMVFFSPPYYQLELYKGKNQSTERYKTYEEWLDKYWKSTIKLCNETLKNNSLLIYIISGYTEKSKYINLEKDMNNITKLEGFKLYKKLNMKGSNVGFTEHRALNESIFIFTKGNINKKELNSYVRNIKKCKKILTKKKR